jgi:S-adenosylmethionine hydrolase
MAEPQAPALVVSFLTDYGLADGFVGALHSVVRRHAPLAPIVDLTHEVAPQNVRAGALALARAAPYLAAGVVVAVVDPGVGTERRALAVRARGGPPDGITFIGPDNGLLTPALDALGGADACVELEDRGYWLPTAGPTFAGRDIFAPAAARLVCGAQLEDLGRPVTDQTLVRLPPPACRRLGHGSLEAEVTWVDRFGNVQLAAAPGDLPADLVLPGQVLVTAKGARLGLARRARAFADLGAGELGLIVDSYGHLALCLNGASAAGQLGVSEADLLVLSRPEGGLKSA